MRGWWDGLAAGTQDALWLALMLAPALLVGPAVLRGFRPFPFVGAMLWRFRWANIAFVAMVAVSVGIGIGLLAQERGLRQGTAAAAEKFDIVVSAPGSEITLLMAAVFLQPADVPLLSGEVYDRIASHPNVALAAPLAFGDSADGAPVVGTTAEFVAHLAGGPVEGRLFADHDEAMAGAAVPLPLGAEVEPAHGLGEAAEEHAHEGAAYRIVGRMPRTGTPWDRAILVPIEAVWEVHGLANGHAPEAGEQLGPPFDAAYFPGTPAIVVRAEELWANYALRSDFTRDAETMAFFPGTVLAQLYAVMGDVRQVMSVMALVTQVLVAASVLLGLVILVRLFRRQLALLRALGAPARFVFAVVWSYAAALLAAGALAGLGVGMAATAVLSRIVTARTDILVRAPLDWPEMHFVAGFVTAATLIALVPALAVVRAPVAPSLRA